MAKPYGLDQLLHTGASISSRHHRHQKCIFANIDPDNLWLALLPTGFAQQVSIGQGFAAHDIRL